MPLEISIPVSMAFGESENDERMECIGVVNKLGMWNTTVADGGLSA